jgi:coenzyme F420-reducing hydrogenase gamma subunit
MSSARLLKTTSQYKFQTACRISSPKEFLMIRMIQRPSVAVHKFSSCDGCQLAFLNLGEALLDVMNIIDVQHFVEAGTINENAKVDIAFVEGSISTPDEQERIQAVRRNSRYLITIGACATAGGLQALRNINDIKAWTQDIYAHPEYIHSLEQVTPIAQHVRVDFELWGCPINSHQILAAIRALLFGVAPLQDKDKVCLECKRQQIICTMVTQNTPCMGAVTRTGCGALCPSFGRDCHACYGPAEMPNTTALSQRLIGLGLSKSAVARRFLFINNAAPAFSNAGKQLSGE